MPTVAQLEYIIATDTLGHFGRAAEYCGVSQPTLSSQIAKVEAELGITLFDRRQKPIATTERGAAFVDRARDVVAAHRRLVKLAVDSAETAGPFALGVIPTLAPYVLPWFLARFAAAYPAVKLAISERPTDELVALLDRDQLDAAICATPLAEPAITERILFYDPFYLYANPAEPLLDDLEVDVDDLDPHKLWLLEDGHCVRTQVIGFCNMSERQHLGSVRFAGGSLETLRHLIDASEGYTLIPETYAQTLSRARRNRQVRAFSDTTPTREVSLVFHRRSAKTSITAALEDIVHDCIPRPYRENEPDDVLPVRERS